MVDYLHRPKIWDDREGIMPLCEMNPKHGTATLPFRIGRENTFILCPACKKQAIGEATLLQAKAATLIENVQRNILGDDRRV